MVSLDTTMDDWLSPSYKHDKFDNPSFDDLVDVFEDLWSHYIFEPVRSLLAMPHGDIAAMAVLSSYFEAIESYRCGQSSKSRSRKFFVKGFGIVFRADHPAIDDAAKAIYEHIRCGLAHQGMLTYKVQYTRACPRAFLLTYPKLADGSLQFEAGVASIVVNPQRMYDGVTKHFEGYVSALREGSNPSLCQAFKDTVHRQWALDQKYIVIGLPEEEFRGGV